MLSCYPEVRLAVYRRRRYLGGDMGVLEISLSLPGVSAGMRRPPPALRRWARPALAKLRLTFDDLVREAARKQHRDRR
jgi:hypothetical protein